jgi:uncharacterized RDD family membrane protein YckC
MSEHETQRFDPARTVKVSASSGLSVTDAQDERQARGGPGNPASPIPAGVLFASMPRRLGARLIDLVIAVVVLTVTFVAIFLLLTAAGAFDSIQGDPATGAGGEPAPTVVGLAFGFIATFGVSAAVVSAYEIVMIALCGATVGKWIFRIRVVRLEDGQVPGWGPSILRWLIPAVGGLAVGIGQLLVYLSPFFDSSGQHRGWHDKVAKTLVIRV